MKSQDFGGSAAGVDMVRRLAQDKIVAETGNVLDVIGEAAPAIRADVCAVGLAHGLTPGNWASVLALPGACWDISRDRARQQTAVDRLFSELSWLTPSEHGREPDDELFSTPDAYRVPPTSQPGRGRSR